MTDWVRLWHDMPTDPKWRVVARKSGQPLACVVALFTLMMTTASAAADRGDVSGLSVEDAAAALDLDEDGVAAILAAMDGRVVSSGRLSGWERRQPKREGPPSTDRVREFRKREASQSKRDETQRNAPETETETDTSEAIASSGKSATSPRRAAKGTHLPDDWQPKEQHFAKAAERGIGRPWVFAQSEKMRDWAIANRNRAVARKADWDRTFSGWIDRDLDKAASPRGSPDRLTQADHILNAHHSLFGQPDDRDHHEVEIFPPGPDQGHRRPDRPVHGPDAGDVGAGRVRDFRGLRAVG